MESRTNSVIVAPVSWQAMNMRTPKGGVIPPIITMQIITMPKWTGSRPSEAARGARNGVVITRMAVASKKQPRMRSASRMRRRATWGFVPEPRIHSSMSTGSRWRVARRPMTEPVASIIRNTPMVVDARARQPTSAANDISR